MFAPAQFSTGLTTIGPFGNLTTDRANPSRLLKDPSPEPEVKWDPTKSELDLYKTSATVARMERRQKGGGKTGWNS
jgi:hypothetical protein